MKEKKKGKTEERQIETEVDRREEKRNEGRKMKKRAGLGGKVE